MTKIIVFIDRRHGNVKFIIEIFTYLKHTAVKSSQPLLQLLYNSQKNNSILKKISNK